MWKGDPELQRRAARKAATVVRGTILLLSVPRLVVNCLANRLQIYNSKTVRARPSTLLLP